MQPFLQTFDEKFRLPAFAGMEARNVVGRAQFTVRTRAKELLDRLDDFVRADARKAKRIVAGQGVIRAANLISTGRELEFGLDLGGGEFGAGRFEKHLSGGKDIDDESNNEFEEDDEGY